MVFIAQITAQATSPAVQVAMVIAGCLGLYVVFKIGGVILKLLLGLIGLALLGGGLWWWFVKMNH